MCQQKEKRSRRDESRKDFEETLCNLVFISFKREISKHQALQISSLPKRHETFHKWIPYSFRVENKQNLTTKCLTSPGLL